MSDDHEPPPGFFKEASKHCRCCVMCCDHPCAGACAGGVCDEARCSCLDENEERNDDEGLDE